MSEVVRDFYESIARNHDVASSVRALGGLRPGVLDAASFRNLEDRSFDAVNREDIEQYLTARGY